MAPGVVRETGLDLQACKFERALCFTLWIALAFLARGERKWAVHFRKQRVSCARAEPHSSEELATTSQQHEDVSRSEGAAPESRRASSLPPRSRQRAQTVAGLSSETSAHQRASGARPLRVCSSVAAMMLALTFTCRALLLFLLSESVQTDKTAVRPELSFLWQFCNSGGAGANMSGKIRFRFIKARSRVTLTFLIGHSG